VFFNLAPIDFAKGTSRPVETTPTDEELGSGRIDVWLGELGECESFSAPAENDIDNAIGYSPGLRIRRNAECISQSDGSFADLTGGPNVGIHCVTDSASLRPENNSVVA
jgi:hypothetical protein